MTDLFFSSNEFLRTMRCHWRGFQWSLTLCIWYLYVLLFFFLHSISSPALYNRTTLLVWPSFSLTWRLLAQLLSHHCLLPECQGTTQSDWWLVGRARCTGRKLPPNLHCPQGTFFLTSFAMCFCPTPKRRGHFVSKGYFPYDSFLSIYRTSSSIHPPIFPHDMFWHISSFILLQTSKLPLKGPLNDVPSNPDEM